MAEHDSVRGLSEIGMRLEEASEEQKVIALRLLDHWRRGYALDRQDLIKLPRFWQLTITIIVADDFKFTWPTWAYHAGIGQWIYTPEPAWPNPRYCERCGPDCAHCLKPEAPKEADGSPMVFWDKIGLGWHCAGDHDEYLQGLERGDHISWPDPNL